MHEKRISQDFWLKGKLIVIESVPAGVCPQCGEKIVKADVGRQLATMIGNVPHSRTKDDYSPSDQVRERSGVDAPYPCLQIQPQIYTDSRR